MPKSWEVRKKLSELKEIRITYSAEGIKELSSKAEFLMRRAFNKVAFHKIINAAKDALR